MTRRQYPKDVTTCHSMLAKRDDIIKELKAVPSDADIDYEELCIQLKAANGEISRLEAEVQAYTEASEIMEKDRDALADELNKCQKQLDQECDSNAELEDKLDEPSPGALLWQEKCNRKQEKIAILEAKLVELDKIDTQVNSKLLEQNKLLEEKLSLCDKYYKEQQDKVHKVGRHVQELVILLDID